MIHGVSNSTFAREVLLSKEPVLVIFVANEREPWRAISWMLEEFGNEMEGQLKVVKVDIDRNPAVRAQYNIHGLPTLIIFVNGEIAARRVGASMQKSELIAWIDASV